jgi:tetratricopeptide (TPR) repeat protein
MPIHPEPAKALSANEERELTRQALQRNPGSPVLRLRLAKLLNQLDAFDETVALLTSLPCGQLDFEALRSLAWAYFALGGAANRQLSFETSERAFAAAADDQQRSRALGDQVKALPRQGKTDLVRDLLRSALELDPTNDDACERLALHLQRRRQPGDVIALTDSLAARGVGHARLFAARAGAFAQLGEIDRAREVLNLSQFLYHQPIRTPAGWEDVERFNAALAGELLTRPELRYNRYGSASASTWRVDAAAVGDAPAMRALLQVIVEAAEGHSAKLSGHPWLASRPERAALRSWCVITGADGFERWHMHPDGWMSGGYYVQVPDAVETHDDGRGCLAFGLPTEVVGEAASEAFGETRVKPRAGSLTLFPSHAHHRTYPHGDAGRRICIAFDVRPA